VRGGGQQYSSMIMLARPRWRRRTACAQFIGAPRAAGFYGVRSGQYINPNILKIWGEGRDVLIKTFTSCVLN
jgi:hypothetical protein